MLNANARASTNPRRSYAAAPPDTLLFFAVASLVGIGLVMIFSASSATAYLEHHDVAYYAKRQTGVAGGRVDRSLWRLQTRLPSAQTLGAVSAGRHDHLAGARAGAARRRRGQRRAPLGRRIVIFVSTVGVRQALAGDLSRSDAGIARRTHHLAGPGPVPAVHSGCADGRARAQRTRHGHRQPAGDDRFRDVLCRRRATHASVRDLACHHAGGDRGSAGKSRTSVRVSLPS